MEERLTKAWEVIAYVLTPHEIHLAVRIIKAEIDDELVNHSILIGHLLNGYVQHYNHVHARSGSLLNRSFRRELVGSEQQLKDLICKIHNLPVAQKLVKHKQQWKYSSYEEQRKNNLTLGCICQILVVFEDAVRYELHHFWNKFILSNILPPRTWIRLLTPHENLFRQNNPLGGHRWSRRKKPPT